jgi:hypothetical protein
MKLELLPVNLMEEEGRTDERTCLMLQVHVTVFMKPVRREQAVSHGDPLRSFMYFLLRLGAVLNTSHPAFMT